MLMDPGKHPTFCKLLVKEGFIDKIEVVSCFIKGNKKMLAKTCLLKTNVGMLWKAKIVRERSKYFICDGDWPQFMAYHQLELEGLNNFLAKQGERGRGRGRGERGKNRGSSRKSSKVNMGLKEPSKNSKEVKRAQDELSDSEEESAPVTKKMKEIKMELSDSEEESVDPAMCSNGGGNPCSPHPGGKLDIKADSMPRILTKPKRPAKDPNKPKRPASAFFVFMAEFRKQFKVENPRVKSIAVVNMAGGDKWNQLPDDEKAPYVAEANKRRAEYQLKKDAYDRREEESDKSMSEVDEKEGSREEEDEGDDN